MTTYIYNCKECKIDEDIKHGMMEDPEFFCKTCNKKLSKVIRNTNFQLKGSGWFKQIKGKD